MLIDYRGKFFFPAERMKSMLLASTKGSSSLLSVQGKFHPFLLEHQGTYILSLLGVIACACVPKRTVSPWRQPGMLNGDWGPGGQGRREYLERLEEEWYLRKVKWWGGISQVREQRMKKLSGEKGSLPVAMARGRGAPSTSTWLMRKVQLVGQTPGNPPPDLVKKNGWWWDLRTCILTSHPLPNQVTYARKSVRTTELGPN